MSNAYKRQIPAIGRLMWVVQTEALIYVVRPIS